MVYYVYVLKNTNKSKLTTYVGYTKDLKNRLKLHNEGIGAKFTREENGKLCISKNIPQKKKQFPENII